MKDAENRKDIIKAIYWLYEAKENGRKSREKTNDGKTDEEETTSDKKSVATVNSFLSEHEAWLKQVEMKKTEKNNEDQELYIGVYFEKKEDIEKACKIEIEGNKENETFNLVRVIVTCTMSTRGMWSSAIAHFEDYLVTGYSDAVKRNVSRDKGNNEGDNILDIKQYNNNMEERVQTLEEYVGKEAFDEIMEEDEDLDNTVKEVSNATTENIRTKEKQVKQIEILLKC
ncbi:4542_t:CDS:2 [Diversispora eburnea]|uniref:4542_t:CDS:1 n=1 Tax=Diversispora eburnea TaxID=1213867 RepID=A0A9N8VZ03_9GLOM|nr:4542_t:CDS:2 [Diversispora eburnea]